MVEGPAIAVVVGAFGRRTHLVDAVQSVEAQTIDRALFELVVVKDFADPAIDATLATAGATVVESHETELPRFLLAGVRASSAPLVTFLDDDDRYRPERLARVLEVVRAHPDVGFYRNRVSVIDPGGAPVPAPAWRPLETDAAFDASGPVWVPPDGKAGLAELALGRTRVSFNSSSMAVRRELLDGAGADRFAAQRLPDSALFCLGALGPYGLYLDDRRLTEYRRHADSLTGRTGFLALGADGYRRLAELARGLGGPELAARFAREGDHFERMYQGRTVVEGVAADVGRSRVAARTAEYLRYLGRHPAERALTLDVWGSAAYGVGYVVAPPLARRALAVRSAGGGA
jgi:glycosyltransferase involved in cell wall biosynthesis